MCGTTNRQSMIFWWWKRRRKTSLRHGRASLKIMSTLLSTRLSPILNAAIPLKFIPISRFVDESHMQISYSTRINEFNTHTNSECGNPTKVYSYLQVCGWVTSYMKMSTSLRVLTHISTLNVVTPPKFVPISRFVEDSHHIRDWVKAHVTMSLVTHMNGS